MAQQVNMDVITGNGAGGAIGMGAVAQRLLTNGFRVESLRTNDVLRKDEWIAYDTAIVEVARERLIAVGDLVSRGLTFNLPNALGTTRLEWEKVSDMGDAEVNMAGITDASRDRVLFDLDSMPIPIIHKDFQINVRVLEASRTTGQPLDVTQAQLCSRIVSEKIESILFSGVTVGGTNGTIYGYTTATNRNTGSVTASWATATGAQIIGDVLAMINKAVADNMYGPYMLYVPYAAYVHMADDYKSESDRTILERVKAVPGIIDVRPTSNLSGTNVIMVQMTRDVVDMINGIQPTMVMWESHGGMQMNFKVMAIMVPRVRTGDYNTQSGLVHYS